MKNNMKKMMMIMMMTIMNTRNASMFDTFRFLASHRPIFQLSIKPWQSLYWGSAKHRVHHMAVQKKVPRTTFKSANPEFDGSKTVGVLASAIAGITTTVV
jgi:hypothetical protein